MSSLEETGTTCTCKASEGFSMSCPDVIKIMDAAGLTTEAVSNKILYSTLNFKSIWSTRKKLPWSRKF